MMHPTHIISTWFKKLYTETGHGWRTLTRGSSANHHVIVKNNGNELGTHTDWVGSGYNLTPTASASTWQHLVATFDGSRTKFYIDGSYVGQLDASEGNNSMPSVTIRVVVSVGLNTSTISGYMG